MGGFETYEAAHDDVVELLVQLVRADTSNPPGDARPAMAVLDAYFREHGLEPVVVGEAEDLPNLVVRLPGSGEGRSLLMLGHLDVVPADPVAWTVPPFAGLVRDGYVWGRGVLDMKNQLATQAVALVRLARRAEAGRILRGDLVYAATADEETGTRCGAAWLFREHPDLVRADFCINEGGLDMFRKAARRLYTIHVGEKGYTNCRITLEGRSGHGSVPLHEDTALGRLAHVLEAVQAYEPEVLEEFLPVEFIEQVVDDATLRAALTDPATAQAAVRQLAQIDPGAAAVIEPLLGLTFAPTGVSAGDAVNVIPASAEVVVDCRTLPGQTQDDVRRELELALAPLDVPWRLELFGSMPGSTSPVRSELREAIVESLSGLVREAEPGTEAVVVETLYPGFTDSVHMRGAFPGTVAYGFCPFIEETSDRVRPRMHSIDERITVRDLLFQAEFAERLALCVAE